MESPVRAAATPEPAVLRDELVPLFSPQTIAISTFVGSLMAGATLLAINNLRLGRRASAFFAVFGCVFALCVVLVLSFFGVPGFVLLSIQAAVISAFAKSSFQSEYAANENVGVPPANPWLAVTITIGWTAIMFAVLMNLSQMIRI